MGSISCFTISISQSPIGTNDGEQDIYDLTRIPTKTDGREKITTDTTTTTTTTTTTQRRMADSGTKCEGGKDVPNIRRDKSVSGFVPKYTGRGGSRHKSFIMLRTARNSFDVAKG